MKSKYIAMAMASALLTVGLIPMGSAQSDPGSAQEGIEVITVVGKRLAPEGIDAISLAATRPAPEGIEVITVVGKQPTPTLASTCVNEVLATRVTGRRQASDEVSAQALESRRANRNSVRLAIKDCIEQAQMGTTHS